MQLKFIKDECCPICGATTVILESREVSCVDANELRTHINGGQWEHRRFICGQEIDYIPNYKSSTLSKFYTCRNDPEYIKRKQRECAAKQKITEYIYTLDVDANFRSRLIDRLGVNINADDEDEDEI